MNPNLANDIKYTELLMKKYIFIIKLLREKNILKIYFNYTLTFFNIWIV